MQVVFDQAAARALGLRPLHRARLGVLVLVDRQPREPRVRADEHEQRHDDDGEHPTEQASSSLCASNFSTRKTQKLPSPVQLYLYEAYCTNHLKLKEVGALNTPANMSCFI